MSSIIRVFGSAYCLMTRIVNHLPSISCKGITLTLLRSCKQLVTLRKLRLQKYPRLIHIYKLIIFKTIVHVLSFELFKT